MFIYQLLKYVREYQVVQCFKLFFAEENKIQHGLMLLSSYNSDQSYTRQSNKISYFSYSNVPCCYQHWEKEVISNCMYVVDNFYPTLDFFFIYFF